MTAAKRKKDQAEFELIQNIEGVAFDEMNLVELPFALLTDAKEARSKPVIEVPLAPDGSEALVSNARSSLPTALAERVVLGLLWLTQQQNGFKTHVVRFPLRILVEQYMYPGRFSKNRASGAFMKRVEEEINRVADTRIHSNRWYDKKLQRTTQMNAAIIDYIQVIHEGGRNSARVVELRWGDQLFNSVKAKYTKALDIRTLLKIQRPLDLRFYRWLDRQLATKRVQAVESCQNFAKYKLLMRGQKIDRGGRTASSYIVGKLRESLEKLNDIGFGVRMTVKQDQSDFRLVFEKLEGSDNESVSIDETAEIVREFQRYAHDLPANAKPRKISESDRNEAARWLEDYEKELAIWLVKRCVKLHKRTRQGEQTLFRFKALSFYEAKALADWEREEAKKKKRDIETNQGLADNVEDAWESYRFEQVTKARDGLSAKKLASLELEAAREVEDEISKAQFKTPKSALKAIIQTRVEEKLMADAGCMDEETFFNQWRG